MTPTPKSTLSVFYAGSLLTPFADIEKEYEASRPGVDVLAEGHGSIQVMRHVTDIHEDIDVVITADQSLIPALMYKTNVPDTSTPYADWYVEFATNEMAIGYTDRSKFASEINSDNWTQILSRPGVRVGIADPRFDANGYRALMLVKLAERQYSRPTLFFDLLQQSFSSPLNVTETAGKIAIRVPEVLEVKQGSPIVMRGYSVQLLPLVRSGDVDYAFEYLSVLKQQGLSYVKLPGQLNLGDPTQAENYGRVRVILDFRRFASVTPDFVGETIGYGATIPSSSLNKAEAERFLAFLLGPEGSTILQRHYHPLIVPPRADAIDKLPQALRALCVPR